MHSRAAVLAVAGVLAGCGGRGQAKTPAHHAAPLIGGHMPGQGRCPKDEPRPQTPEPGAATRTLICLYPAAAQGPRASLALPGDVLSGPLARATPLRPGKSCNANLDTRAVTVIRFVPDGRPAATDIDLSGCVTVLLPQHRRLVFTRADARRVTQLASRAWADREPAGSTS